MLHFREGGGRSLEAKKFPFEHVEKNFQMLARGRKSEKELCLTPRTPPEP